MFYVQERACVYRKQINNWSEEQQLDEEATSDTPPQELLLLFILTGDGWWTGTICDPSPGAGKLNK